MIFVLGGEGFVGAAFVRHCRAEGLAQSGLGLAGGPEGEAFLEVSVAVRDCAWFDRVIEDRVSICAPASSSLNCATDFSPSSVI